MATAPQTDQVAYVAPNSTQGEIDALDAIASNAIDPSVGMDFTALSISWGQCEQDYTSNDLDALHQALANVVAVGVTVFASSGDSGAYDCSQPGSPDNSLAVDYPASDPNVIAVGGLTTDPTIPAEGSWWDSSSANAGGFLGAGGGGGQSVYWAQPAWQNNRYPGTTNRLVPDISLDADPASGWNIRAEGSWFTVGGTSLASPLAAATLADLQISVDPGSSYGLGNIAPNLYGANAADFRDTTTGTNGYFEAGSGYDLATGLGAPLWGKLSAALLGSPQVSAPSILRSDTIPLSVHAPAGMQYIGYRAGLGTSPSTCNSSGSAVQPPTSVDTPGDGTFNVWVLGYVSTGNCFETDVTTVVDSKAPTVTVSATTAPLAGSNATFAFSPKDAAPSSGHLHYNVTVTRSDTHATVYHAIGQVVPHVVVREVAGVTYQAAVVVTDWAGNASPATGAHATAPLPATAFHRSRGWTATHDTAAVAHTVLHATIRGATLTIRVRGSSFNLLAYTCPSCGVVQILIDGHTVKMWNSYSSTTHKGVPLTIGRYGKSGIHTIVIRVTGTKTTHSHGTLTDIEGLYAYP